MDDIGTIISYVHRYNMAALSDLNSRDASIWSKKIIYDVVDLRIPHSDHGLKLDLDPETMCTLIPRLFIYFSRAVWCDDFEDTDVEFIGKNFFFFFLFYP